VAAGPGVFGQFRDGSLWAQATPVSEVKGQRAKTGPYFRHSSKITGMDIDTQTLFGQNFASSSEHPARDAAQPHLPEADEMVPYNLL